MRVSVVGVTFEGRQEIIERYCNVGDTVYLRAEPDNPYDKNAIKVFVVNPEDIETKYAIGYLPKHAAAYVAPLLDGESTEGYIVSIKGGTEGFSFGVVIDFQLENETET
jgi:hypothetical protein